MAPRRCTACNKTGHSVTTCTSRAAAVIRDLREKLKLQRVGQKRKPGRATTKRPAAQARAKYTPKPGPDKRKLVRRTALKERSGKGLMGMLGGDDRVALEHLHVAGYVPRHKKCPECKKGALSGPAARKDMAGAHLWYRCTSNACNARFNALKHSMFSSTKLTPKQLAMVIQQYTNTDKTAPIPSDNLAADCEGGRVQVASVVEKLRAVEVAVAKKQNNAGQLTGDLEVDEHGVRSYHVSKTNAAYEQYHSKALLKKSHPYYLNYIRVIGLRKRGCGRVFVHFLPPKLLPPKSRPPPVSEQEVIDSGILKRAKPGSCVIHSDGALAYQTVIKSKFPKLKHRSVSHRNMEFVKAVTPVRMPSGLSASSSGTQCIDSTWRSLDQTIPAALHTKKGHTVNPLVEEYTWCWLYRINHRMVDGFACLGAYIRAS